jgi:hypothetical protein
MTPEEVAGFLDAMDPRLPPTEELRTLTRELFERVSRGDGRILRRQVFEGAEKHQCLENAAEWVRSHPGDRLVYGYVYFDFRPLLRHVRFTPHVAVCTAAGEWLDVTPHNALDDHPFLPHTGTEEEFGIAFTNGPMDLICR